MPPSGRDKIRSALREAKVHFAWFDRMPSSAFVRDELSKGRFDDPKRLIVQLYVGDRAENQVQRV